MKRRTSLHSNISVCFQGSGEIKINNVSYCLSANSELLSMFKLQPTFSHFTLMCPKINEKEMKQLIQKVYLNVHLFRDIYYSYSIV